jgi:putative endonuclease
MYYVYILKCSNSSLYVGYSADLKQRIGYHIGGKVISTVNRLPVELVHYEAFKSKKDAKAREVFLKSGYGRKQISSFLKNTLIFPEVR